jgi:hypothetical protein
MLPTVISTTAIQGNIEIDGRFWVTEIQNISDGTSHIFYYLAEVGLDYNQVALDRATAINEAAVNG